MASPARRRAGHQGVRAWLWLAFTLGLVSPLGCNSGHSSTPGSDATAPVAPLPCDPPDAKQVAELDAPTAEGFSEVAVVAGRTEAALVYAQWNHARQVAVKLQRLTLGGVVLGAPILLHTYTVNAGQLAVGFYGGLTVATDGSRYLACWGELPIACASVAVATGDVSLTRFGERNFSTSPHVMLAPSGWLVFYKRDSDGLAQKVGTDTKPIGAPVAVPLGSVTATTSGYAVLSELGAISRLNPALTPAGSVSVESANGNIAASGDVLSVVGRGWEIRVDPANHTTETLVADPSTVSAMAVAPRMGSFGVVWSSKVDSVVRFREVDAASHLGPVRNVACGHKGTMPSVAATGDGFLVAVLGPEDPDDIFYNTVYATVRVSHVPQP